MAKTKKDTLWPTDKELRQELEQINRQLKEAYDRFNYACEPELVEASIFEINALKAKYDYFLRCVKERAGMPVGRGAAVPLPREACAAASAGTAVRINIKNIHLSGKNRGAFLCPVPPVNPAGHKRHGPLL